MLLSSLVYSYIHGSYTLIILTSPQIPELQWLFNVNLLFVPILKIYSFFMYITIITMYLKISIWVLITYVFIWKQLSVIFLNAITTFKSFLSKSDSSQVSFFTSFFSILMWVINIMNYGVLFFLVLASPSIFMNRLFVFYLLDMFLKMWINFSAYLRTKH